MRPRVQAPRARQSARNAHTDHWESAYVAGERLRREAKKTARKAVRVDGRRIIARGED